MLGLCEEEGVQPQVFCLAINYLDRFLSVCNIRRTQLQLLGAVCLLVSWKVRAHSSITAQKLVEFSDFNVSLEDLLEWEFLLLSKLDWDLSAVIAPDFVEHILQRLLKLDLAWSIEVTRAKVSTLVCLCYSRACLACLSPSLIAASSILTTLRPGLETGGCLLSAPRDTPSPSSSSSSSHSSPPTHPHTSDPLHPLLQAMEKITTAERRDMLGCMQQLESIMQSSLPPSPDISEDESSPSHQPSSSSSPISSSRRLFPSSTHIDSTPTKLLDAIMEFPGL